MHLLLDSFWRASAYCLHPRVILLSLLPLLLMVGLTLGLGYFYWDAALDMVRLWLESFTAMTTVWGWLDSVGLSRLKTILVPLLVVFAVTPLIIFLTLLVVAWLMTPATVRLVARRRFPVLEAKQGAGFWTSVLWSLVATLLALCLLVLSIPLWLIPPLVLVLPPLVWGWLCYRVLAFDALAEHASAEERREILRQHRLWLLGMGVVSGYLGAAPSLVWASGALFAAAFVLLVPVAVWIYTLVFAFSSLWFTHYCLRALEMLRADRAAAATVAAPGTNETTVEEAAGPAPSAAPLALESSDKGTTP